MEKVITIRLTKEVFSVLELRAKALGAPTGAVARQALIDGLNGAAHEHRIKEAVVAGIEARLTEYTKAVIQLAAKKNASP